MRPETLIRKRRRFLFFYFSILSISSIILFGAFLLKAIFADPMQALFSEVIDGVVFETAAFVGATIAGAAMVGLIIDHYQQKLGEESDYLKEVLENEGILAIYQNANDPILNSRLIELITTAHREIFAFGLGLGILYNNRGLLQKMAEQTNKISTLKLTIVTGASENKGVLNRIEEEFEWHNEMEINYDTNWVNNFPAEIRSYLNNLLDEESKPRVIVKTLDSCFMFGAIIIDDVVLMFLYGSPDIRGSESPWYEFVYDKKSEGEMAKFIRRSKKYYQNKLHQG